MPSKNTFCVAQTLFSRCLESDLKPDRLQFTKLLYLLDYCQYRLNEKRVTDIDWIFYHYGPWAFEIPIIMESVMSRYPFGWEDRSENYGGNMPKFDAAERMDFGIENIFNKLIKTFRNKDTNCIIEWCYKQTEPMQSALRGEKLDFTTIEITKALPMFFPKTTTHKMPTIPKKFQEQRATYKAKIQQRRNQVKKWRENLQADDYIQAMNIISNTNCANIPDLEGTKVSLSGDVVDKLSNWGNE